MRAAYRPAASLGLLIILTLGFVQHGWTQSVDSSPAAQSPSALSTAAEQYNDRMVAEQDSVIAYIQAFTSTFTSGDRALMDARRVSLVDRVQRSLTVLEGMDAFEGDTTLRDEAIAVFSFYLSVFQNEYADIISLISRAEIGAGENARLRFILQAIDSRERELDDAWLAAQEAFADEWNFDLEHEDEQP